MSVGCWWAEPDSDCCWAWVRVILATENRGSRPVAAFLAGREVVDRVAASSWGAKENWFSCYLWQPSCWLPGLATILTGKAE